MNRRIQSLERQIEKIKRELLDIGDLRPGSLSRQYNVCGNPTCKCKATLPTRSLLVASTTTPLAAS